MMNREEHLLTILTEECSEVIKEISKALRFGLDDYPPGSDVYNTNRKRITCELNDLIGIAELLKSEGYIDDFMNSEKILKKQNRIEEYLLYSKKSGKFVE